MKGHTFSLPAVEEIRKSVLIVLEQADGVDPEDSDWVRSTLVTISQAAGKILDLLPSDGEAG
jgi:hypothetical protein